MAINRNFLVYNTKSKFSSDLGNDLIPANAIVFVKDTGEIYSHGSYFGGDISGGNSDYKSILLNGVSSNISIYGHKHPYTDLTGSTTTANQAIVSNGTANGWTLKTLGSGAFDSTNYLPLTGGTLSGTLNMGNNSITDLAINGGIYWDSYVESSSDPSDVASIRVISGGVAGGTELRIEQDNDANDVVNIVTNSINGLLHNGVNVLNASNYGSYALPLSGGTMSGTLTTHDLLPSATNAYSIGSATNEYANVYANNFNGNASSSTTATYATLLSNITGSTSISNWNPLNFTYQVWGQSFINSSISSDSSDITFWLRPNGEGTELCMFIDGDYYSCTHKVLNEGNYSNYALPLHGTADNASKLGGLDFAQPGNFQGVMRSFSRGQYTDINQYFGNGVVVTFNPTPTNGWSANQTILSLGDSAIRNTQLSFIWNTDDIKYRRITDGPTYQAWRTIAFTDGNVATASVASRLGQNGDPDQPMKFMWSGQSGQPAWLWGGNDGTNMYVYNPSNFNVNSATKLSTARTLWGQSFDGTGNINGPLVFHSSRMGFSLNYSDTWSDGTSTHPWYGYDKKNTSNDGVYSTVISDFFGLSLKTGSGFICLTRLGAVGINTASPSCMLDVAGTGRFQGDLVIGNTTIHASGSNGGINSIQPADDYIIGDCNIVGTMGLKSLNSYSAGIGFYGQDGGSYGTLTASASGLTWNAGAIRCNSGFEGSLTGNATSATEVIVNQHSGNNVNYPLVWSNDSSTNSVTSNQLYKTASNLYFNPSTMQLTATGGFNGNLNGSASSLSVNAGSSTNPIYFSGGVPVATNYTFGNGSGNIPVSNGTLNTNLNANLLNGHGTSSGGANPYNTIPVVDSDGILNIGNRINFHEASSQTANSYISSTGGNLLIQADIYSTAGNLGTKNLPWGTLYTNYIVTTGLKFFGWWHTDNTKMLKAADVAVTPFSIVHNSTGNFTVTHNIRNPHYTVIITEETADYDYYDLIQVRDKTATSFGINIRGMGGDWYDSGFEFAVFY